MGYLVKNDCCVSLYPAENKYRHRHFLRCDIFQRKDLYRTDVTYIYEETDKKMQTSMYPLQFCNLNYQVEYRPKTIGK